MSNPALVRQLVQAVTLREDAAPPPLVDAIEHLISIIESNGDVGEFPLDWAQTICNFVSMRHR